MSEEDRNPKSVTEALENYLAGSKPGRVRSLEDDLPSELITRAFLPELATPRPEAPPPPAIPPGWVRHPEAARYLESMRDKDFDAVRERMLATLDPQARAEADSDYESFNWHYKATQEGMRQEREEMEARAKEQRDRIRAQKEREAKILANVDTGNFRTMDAAAKIAERFMK